MGPLLQLCVCQHVLMAGRGIVVFFAYACIYFTCFKQQKIAKVGKQQ